MKLYYVEYNPNRYTPYLGFDSEVFAHYIEITDLGAVVEHQIPIESSDYYDTTAYNSLNDYFSTYKGGKSEFLKQGMMVRIL